MKLIKQPFDINRSLVKDFIISSEKVANVQVGNTIEHALLVLTKTGYSSIPVLDYSYKLQGLISMPKIMDKTLGLERIELENLETIKVEEVMLTDIPMLREETTFKEGLLLLIDHPFICVVDKDGLFTGIFTRREALKNWRNSLFVKDKSVE